MLKVDTDHRGRPRGGLLPLHYVECPARRPGHETIRLITSLSEQRLPLEQYSAPFAPCFRTVAISWSIRAIWRSASAIARLFRDRS